MRADSRFEKNDSQTRFAIYVNGIRVVDEMLVEEEKKVTVLLDEETERNIVRAIKLSESQHSTFGIVSIEVLGEISPTESKEHLIEFVGDSITCGYGVDDEVREHAFSTTTEDVTKAYAYKTAERLDADYSMVSFSGYGVVSGNSKDGNKVAARIVPRFYEMLGYCNSVYMGEYQAQKSSWDFSKREPELIVINLGTNDKTYVRGDAEKTEEFILGYVEFLKQIRKCNPNAKLLCILGIMGTDLCPAIEEAVARYQNETRDFNIDFVPFAEQNSSVDGIAAGGHPTERTHNKIAEQLAEVIRNIMGW